jgi:hypothetical protein
MGRKGQWWDSKARARDGIQHSGKKASRKKVKQNAVQISPAPEVLDEKVESVYRYFDDEKFANDFAKGIIYVSTLEKCRAYEDPLKGDSEEGYDLYSTGGSVTGNGSDPKFVKMAARANIYIDPRATNVTLEMNSSRTILQHAYVLCTTIGFDSDDLENTFGKYCVKIEDVEGFFVAVSRCLASNVGSLRGMRRSIVYKERYSEGMQEAPGPIGFVKPPDKYAAQREYRFLWVKHDEGPVQPLVIDCSEAAQYIERIK